MSTRRGLIVRRPPTPEARAKGTVAVRVAWATPAMRIAWQYRIRRAKNRKRPFRTGE